MRAPSKTPESVFGLGLGVAVAYFPADAQAEVDEGREADHQPDVGVEAFEGRKGEKAYRAVVRHWVTENGKGCGEHSERGRRSEVRVQWRKSKVYGRRSEGIKTGGGRGDRPPVVRSLWVAISWR